MAQIKIYGVRERLDPIKRQLSDVIHACVVEALQYPRDKRAHRFFPLERDQKMIEAPLVATEMAGKVDVWVRVKGGGPTGQTGATVLGIARALQAKDHSLHPRLSDGGFLTRDGRMVERKKYGHKKARRSFQFSKR